jgi:hypothetical protein
LDLFDVAAAERAEAEIDKFVQRRVREAKDADAVEDLWAEDGSRGRGCIAIG